MNAHKELHNDKLESLDSDSRYDVSVNSDISNNKLTKTPNVMQNIHGLPHNYFVQSSIHITKIAPHWIWLNYKDNIFRGLTGF